ncbi:MAG: hypothetical protein KGD65_09210 [Candidatus Lokiarchaeota archaeon]|nr:hypothetical protein [Candidatus Lokiarchaeota archaeon]
MATSKNIYKLIISLSIFVGIICILCLYLFTLQIILDNIIEGTLQIVLIISTRIVILSITTYYLFHKWFHQEAQYLSDIPFLLGLFFLILIFGKFVDLHWDLTFLVYDEATVLSYLKFRFILIIIEVAPLLFLGLEIIFFRIEDKFPRLKDKRYMNKLRAKIMALITGIELVVVFIIPNFTIMGMFLPVILIPSLIGIVYIFFLAYRLNRLTVVKPNILTIAFFLYLLSNVFRPLMQNILGDNPSYIIIVEWVDLIIFIVIFLGLYKKS